MDTQLIAHDREVYDIAWGGLGVFATVSADGSVRVFDLRWVRRPGRRCDASKKGRELRALRTWIRAAGAHLMHSAPPNSGLCIEELIRHAYVRDR